MDILHDRGPRCKSRPVTGTAVLDEDWVQDAQKLVDGAGHVEMSASSVANSRLVGDIIFLNLH